MKNKFRQLKISFDSKEMDVGRVVIPDFELDEVFDITALKINLDWEMELVFTKRKNKPLTND